MSPEMQDAHLDNFALRCFRDTADGDYVAARMAYRADLIPQALWASQQTIEKYIKCILLLRRIESRKATHFLIKLLSKLEEIFPMRLSPETRRFVEYIDIYGPDRYLTYPYSVEGSEILKLDQAVWEIRRYCIPYQRWKGRNGARLADMDVKQIVDGEKKPFQEYRPLIPGLLDNIIAQKTHPARPHLIWKNLYFGTSRRTRVALSETFQSVNSPLALYPEIYDEVAKYVHLPKELG
jgi:HEPN domain-containing protein